MTSKANAQFGEMYRQLNPEQKRAVDTIEGPVMVLAGPGTGKTQVIAMRIANILRETHMDPWNILCLTFTESGVVAMRERLLKIIGSPAYQVRINTFHSFCNDIIQEYPDVFAQAKNWQMISDIERIDMYRSIIDELPARSPLRPLADPYMFLNAISNNVKKLKQEGIAPESFADVLRRIEAFVQQAEGAVDSFAAVKANERTDTQCDDVRAKVIEGLSAFKLPDSFAELVEKFYQGYADRLRVADGKRQQGSARTAFKNDIKKWFDGLRNNLTKQQDLHRIYEIYQEKLVNAGRYDYEDMITSVVVQLKQNDALLARYQEAYQYVLVDEYQDTNGAQNEVVYLLGSFDDQPNLFVVGDDKQSIYRFQGASVNNMLSFYETYKEHVAVISLKHNYRSQASVLQAAGAVIQNNQAALVKYIPHTTDELIAATDRAAQNLILRTFGSEDMEDYGVAVAVKALLEQGVQPSEIAVLFRYNRDGEELLRMMRSQNVPARLEIGEDVLADIAIRQWLALLSYLANMDGDDLLADILLYSWWRLDALETLKVIRYAGGSRKRLFDVIGSDDELAEAGISDPEGFMGVAKLLATWRKHSANTTLSGFLYDMLSESGWLEYVLDGNDELPVLQKMAALLQQAKELNMANRDLTIDEFIKNIRLLTEHGLTIETEPWQIADNAVRLMTAHRAKGLEFEHVFITRLNDRHWGNNPDNARVPLPHGLVQYDPIVAQENNEDERRLFYVAMTRAKQGIILTRAKHKTNGRPTVPSLFLQELPSDLVVEEEQAETPNESVARLREGVLRPLPAAGHEDIEGWIRALVKNEVLSVTHLNNYLECPRKFYVRNVLQVPQPRSFHQALGSAIHGALDEFCQQYKRERVLPSKQQLVDFFTFYLSRELLTPKERERVEKEGTLILIDYYTHYQKEFIRETVGEVDFRSHGVNVDGIPLTGKIDKIELLDESAVNGDASWKKNAEVNVVDYKTGNPDKGLRRLKKGEGYYRQLVFYKLLCDSSAQFPYIMASGEVDFIQPSDKSGFVKKRLSITDDDVEELKETIRRVWEEIQALRFLDDSMACGKCEYCTSK